MNKMNIKVIFVFVAIILVCCTTKKESEPLATDTSKLNSDEKFVMTIKDSTALRVKAAMACEQDDYLNAAKLYDQLILIFPWKGEYYYKRGFSNAQLNNDSSAVSDFLIAIKYDYRKFDSYKSLGIIYMFKLGDTKQATFYFRKAVELNPNDEETLKYLEAIESDGKKSL